MLNLLYTCELFENILQNEKKLYSPWKIGPNKKHERYCKNILMTTYAQLWKTHENQTSVNVCFEMLWKK